MQPDDSRSAVATKDLPFTWSGALLGARRTVGIAIGDVAFSMVFGALAREAGLSLGAAVLVSALVFAGAAQLAALGLFASGPTPPTLAIAVTTLLVNLRHLLMGAALHPWLARLSRRAAHASMFFMTDETWALTLREQSDRPTAASGDGAFMLGSGLALWTAGVVGTAAGHLLGALVREPERWGLDFMFVALFLGLLVGAWRGRADLTPWLVAGGVSIAASAWVPGKWYIVLGAIAGSVVGAGRDAA